MGLPSDHRLVYSRVALQHNAVHGNALAGAHDHDIPDLDSFGGDLLLLPVP
jgi:hypothetical protein